jgi:phosphatidylinositol glycan class S
MRVQLEDLSSPKLDTIRFQVVVVLWTIVLLISPLWYHLTQVYRASIPYEGIAELQHIHPHVGIRFAVDYEDIDLDFVKKTLGAQFPPNLVNYEFTIRKSLTPQQGEYFIKVECSKKNRMHVHKDRRISLSIEDCPRNAQQIIVNSISSIFIPELQDLISSKEKLRVLKYSKEYQIIFSLLVEDPGHGIIQWDIEQAVQDYVHPLLKSFENITEFQVSSQIQNYASLPISPREEGKGYDHKYVLTSNELKQFINSAEWNFASVVSNKSPIQFVAYVPSRNLSPLFIKDEEGKLVDRNSFLVYQWGGITIQNLEHQNTFLNSADLKPWMEVFVHQLRILMGVEPISAEQNHKLLVYMSNLAQF